MIALDHTTISQFVLTDGNAAPATLVANTHYRIESIRAGLIKLLNLATFVQPLRAAYRYGARTSVAMLKMCIRDSLYAEHDRFVAFGRGWTRRIAENLRYAARDLA